MKLRHSPSKRTQSRCNIFARETCSHQGVYPGHSPATDQFFSKKLISGGGHFSRKRAGILRIRARSIREIVFHEKYLQELASLKFWCKTERATSHRVPAAGKSCCGTSYPFPRVLRVGKLFGVFSKTKLVTKTCILYFGMTYQQTSFP